MTESLKKDIDVLIPPPVLYRIGDKELRQQALPVKKLMEVIRFVEKNYDALEKLKKLGKPKEEGGMCLSELLEGEVYIKANELVRLLLPLNKDILTDEWCLENLSNAHYVAIIKTALIQNQLYDVFTKAKGFVVAHLEASLRKVQEAKTVASA